MEGFKGTGEAQRIEWLPFGLARAPGRIGSREGSRFHRPLFHPGVETVAPPDFAAGAFAARRERWRELALGLPAQYRGFRHADEPRNLFYSQESFFRFLIGIIRFFIRHNSLLYRSAVDRCLGTGSQRPNGDSECRHRCCADRSAMPVAPFGFQSYRTRGTCQAILTDFSENSETPSGGDRARQSSVDSMAFDLPLIWVVLVGID